MNVEHLSTTQAHALRSLHKLHPNDRANTTTINRAVGDYSLPRVTSSTLNVLYREGLVEYVAGRWELSYLGAEVLDELDAQHGGGA